MFFMHDISPPTQTQGEIWNHKCKWFLGWTVNKGRSEKGSTGMGKDEEGEQGLGEQRNRFLGYTVMTGTWHYAIMKTM